MMGERRLAAKPDAVRHGAGAPFAGAGAYQVALELGRGNAVMPFDLGSVT
jgi:hypothetical protein